MDSLHNGFPFVNIALLNSLDSSNIKGTITDELGNYEFLNLKSGNYKLRHL